jgi:hypothetical protein
VTDHDALYHRLFSHPLMMERRVRAGGPPGILGWSSTVDGAAAAPLWSDHDEALDIARFWRAN